MRTIDEDNSEFKKEFYETFGPERKNIASQLMTSMKAAINKGESATMKNKKYFPLHFYITRFFRIIPFWCLNVLFYSLYHHSNIKIIFSNLFFLFGFISDETYKIVPGSWSLFVEELYYLIFPIIFLRLLKLKDALLFFICSFFIHLIFIKYSDHFHSDLTSVNFYGSPFLNFYWLFIGILFFHIQYKNDNLNIFQYYHHPYNLLTLAFLLLTPFCGDELFRIILLSLIFLGAYNRETIIYYVSQSRLILALGKFCFSIYFIHFYVLDILGKYQSYILKTILPNIQIGEIEYLLNLLIALIGSLTFGAISYYLIERPCVKLGKIVIKKLAT